jgi:hypothetical protein
MTSTSVGWALLDGQGPDAATLDHDAFDVRSVGDATASDTSQHVAAARGAQSIAMASGHKVCAVQVTWTSDVEADGAALLKSLADLGFENVLALRLSRAVQAWGIEVGRVNEHHTTALCVLEPDTATVMVVATGAGTVRTAVIDNRETTEALVESLRTIFGRDGWLPESLHLVGSRSDLDQVAEPIGDALPIPVIETFDTQLALARGAALVAVGQVDTGVEHAAETPGDRPWRVSPAKVVASPTPPEPIVTPSVGDVDTGSSQEADAPRNEPPPRRERRWVASRAKKLTISAAAVAVCGVALSLTAGSALNVENVSAEAAEPPAGGASVTSASVHAVPAPVSAPSAPPVQPLAAQPPPAPPASPEPVAPPEPLALPSESVASVAPRPVAVPVPHHPVPAPPSATPLAAPAAPAAPAPAVAPAPAAAPAPAVAPAPVAPPPVAAEQAPPAPPPAAVPQAPAEPPPPPDPVQVLLSPLFSGLP